MSWAAEGELLPTELLGPGSGRAPRSRAEMRDYCRWYPGQGVPSPIWPRTRWQCGAHRGARLYKALGLPHWPPCHGHSQHRARTGQSRIRNVARDVVYLRPGTRPGAGRADLRGSWHYDACYPPRAFVIEEHLHASADHSKRVSIGGINAGVFSPAIQLAIGANRLHALQIGLEWSGSWEISAGWAQSTFRGEPTPSFTLACQMGSGVITIGPGCAEPLPAIHLCSTDAIPGPQLTTAGGATYTTRLPPGRSGAPGSRCPTTTGSGSMSGSICPCS